MVLNTKSTLRIEYRRRREFLSESQIADRSIEISNRCLRLNIWEYSFYHLFMTAKKKKEFDTSYLLSVLQGKDKHLVIPKMVDDYLLEHYLLTDQTTLKMAYIITLKIYSLIADQSQAKVLEKH